MAMISDVGDYGKTSVKAYQQAFEKLELRWWRMSGWTGEPDRFPGATDQDESRQTRRDHAYRL